MSIKNKIGVPVTGDNFFGRTRELSRAHRYLEEGQSLLLSAPRRIGKSSLAKKLIADMTDRGWKCVYIDLQGVGTTEEFLRKLIDAFTGVGLMEKTGKKIKDFLNSTFQATETLELGGLKIDLSHRGQLESMYSRLAETFDYTHDTLIVIDELPLFLGKLMDEEGRNRNEIDFLLNWFRSIRQNEDSPLRWLFSGSVGLRNFTNYHKRSQAINDLVELELGALPEDEASGLIKALAQSYNLVIDDEVVAKTLDLIQWSIPYIIQLLMDRLISKSRETDNYIIVIEDVKEALNELSKSNYFITWDERLVEYRDLEGLARFILDNVSVTEKGLSKVHLLQALIDEKGQSERNDIAAGRDRTETIQIKNRLTKALEMLEHDGYIERDGENRRFRSPLLRQWWKYRFVD